MGRIRPASPIGGIASALVKLFIIQLTRGCGNERCISTSCHTYCTRTADRPYRPWTELSARAIAFQLACEPKAVDLLCHDSNGNALLEVAESDIKTDAFHATKIAEKGPVDEKSMYQATFDTDAIVNFLNDGRVKSDSARAHLQTIQEFDDNLYSLPARLHEADDDASTYSLVDTILSSLHSLFKHIDSRDWPFSNTPPHAPLVMFLVSDHTTMHMGSRLARTLNHLYDTAGRQSGHARTVQNLLLLALNGPIATSNTHERRLDTSSSPSDDATISANMSLRERVLNRRNVLGLGSKPQHSLLFEVMTAAFLSSWNGSGDVLVGSPADYALSTMDWLETRFGPINPHLPHLHRLLADRLDLVRILRQAAEGIEPRIFAYSWLFTSLQQATMFRARRLLRMEAAVDASILISKLQAADFPHLSREHYLQMQDLSRLHLYNASSTVLYIQGKRHTALTDAFDALWKRDLRELLRPLRVYLDGVVDIGQDAGGVAQEFLQLCWVQVMDPDLGLFTVDEQTRMAWFSSHHFEPSYKYDLLGVLFALSLHNGFVLPVTFPLALYKRLLGNTSNTINDIEDGWPDIARGLKKLRDWDLSDGAVEDVFGLDFDFAVRTLDEVMVFDMTKGDHARVNTDAQSRSPAVTAENRLEYISCYSNWLIDLSVKPKLSAFVKGFHSLLPPTELHCLTPETLRTLAEGDQAGADFSIDLLRRHTKYEGGYTDHSNAIHYFWKIVKTWDITLKRQFLMFVTASDRLPVNGERGLAIEIVRQPLDLALFEYDAPGRTSEQNSRMVLAADIVELLMDEHERLGSNQRSMKRRWRDKIMMLEAPLPTSNTCFARLNLPDYEDEAVLKFKLEKALKLGWLGFGLA